MARTVSPGNAPTPSALNIKQPKIDVSPMVNVATAKIEAANSNFALYAQGLIESESAKAFKTFSSNPIQLSNALSKIPGMLSDLPEEIQNRFISKFYLDAVNLVQKAETNRITRIDQEALASAQAQIGTLKDLSAQSYQAVLAEHVKNAEEKSPIVIDSYRSQLASLNDLANLRNSSGKYAFSDTQRRAILNNEDLQLSGFKQYFDNLVTNDNPDLEESKNYYTKFMLAPERYMQENFMARETYEAARKYAEQRLKSAGADIKNARFNQSVMDAMALSVENLPGKMQALKESGLINSNLIKSLEDTTVKFDSLDYAKPITPLGIFNTLDIVGSQTTITNRNESDQLRIIEDVIKSQDALAEYADKYGFSEKDTKRMRTAITLKAADANFAGFMNSLNNLKSNMLGIGLGYNPIERVRASSGTRAPWTIVEDITQWDGMNNADRIKYTKANLIMAQAIDAGILAVRSGQTDQLGGIFKKADIEITKLNYPQIDWNSYMTNQDAILQFNGLYGKIIGFNGDGTFNFEEVK